MATIQTNIQRVAIYSRVSGEEQVKNTSLDGQVDKCRDEAARRGWRVVATFREEGVSGTLLERPALSELLQGCRNGNFDVVLVANLDRLSRDEFVRLSIERNLREVGVRRIALDVPHGSDTDDENSEMFAGMLGLASQFERKKIIGRMAFGAHRSASERGGWPTSRTPFGYRHREREKDSRLVIDEDQAQVIHLIAGLLVDEGLSTGQVALRLNALGLLTPTGSRWTHQNVRHKMRSRGLRGEFAWGKPGGATGKYGVPKEVRADPILTEERWAAVQAALDRRAFGRKTKSKPYPLSGGRLICWCGSPFGGAWRHDRDLRQYRCRDTKSTPDKPRTCGARRLNADWVEGIIWAEVVKLLADVDCLRACVADYVEMRQGQVSVEQQELVGLGEQVAKLERALQRAMHESLLSDDPEVIRPVLLALENDLRSARMRRVELEAWQRESASESNRVRDLERLAEQAARRLPGLEPAHRAGFFEALDIRVTLLDAPPDAPARGGNPHSYQPWQPRLRVEGSVPHSKLIDALVGDPGDHNTPPA